MHCRWHPHLAYKKNTRGYILLKTLKNSCGMTSCGFIAQRLFHSARSVVLGGTGHGGHTTITASGSVQSKPESLINYKPILSSGKKEKM